MEKAVLMSIQPKWVELISVYTKTVEIRKTAPKLDTPFTVYIYQSKHQHNYGFLRKLGGYCNKIAERLEKSQGKVIGEFTCDYIDKLPPINDENYLEEKDTIAMSCIMPNEFISYSNNKPLYAWYITDLTIYDEPKELKEFHTTKKCRACKWSGYESAACIYDENCKVPFTITKAPQSWCYVDKL